MNKPNSFVDDIPTHVENPREYTTKPNKKLLKLSLARSRIQVHTKISCISMF